MRYEFPKDFLWGVATASAQVEGAAFEDGKKATMIFDRSTRAGENYDRELIEELHALAPAGDMLGMAVRMLEAAEREEGGEWIY